MTRVSPRKRAARSSLARGADGAATATGAQPASGAAATGTRATPPSTGAAQKAAEGAGAGEEGGGSSPQLPLAHLEAPRRAALPSLSPDRNGSPSVHRRSQAPSPRTSSVAFGDVLPALAASPRALSTSEAAASGLAFSPAASEQVESFVPSRPYSAGSAALEVEAIRHFLIERDSSILRSWIRHFDKNFDRKISLNEFIRVLSNLGYGGNVTRAITALDPSSSGELSLSELDADEAMLWQRFGNWCVQSFNGPNDMIRQLGKQCGMPEDQTVVDKLTFQDGLHWLGWTESVDLLFQALDLNDAGRFSAASLTWLEVAKVRQRRKEHARRMSMKNSKHSKALERRAGQTILEEFRYFLKRKHGHLVRAWRLALTSDDSMVLQKAEVLRAVAALGFQGDVRLLWRAFDKDDSGTVSVEELDPKGAQLLAHFRRFIMDNFGSASAAFRALDRFNTKQLREPEFIEALRSFGFHLPARQLFQNLDLERSRTLLEQDLLFLDRWRPPAFLIAAPNPGAAEEVKALLLKSHKNYLRAWRHCLDRDSSNRCNWQEFEMACKQVGFQGDVPGAWRALDNDLSGFITLAEIDANSCETLYAFKRWADEEFGGVRAAFSIFDSDGSNAVSWREFRRVCRAYGLDRDVHQLFHALDVERSGVLSLGEVIFLDDWEFKLPGGLTSNGANAGGDGATDAATEATTIAVGWMQTTEAAQPVELTAYATLGPGPGAYNVSTPYRAVVSGAPAFTFQRRPKAVAPLWGPRRDTSSQPSPGDYNEMHGLARTVPSKPRWSFPRAGRDAAKRAVVDESCPGPGDYAPLHYAALGVRSHHGPAAKCSPRRPFCVHPLYRSIEPRLTVRSSAPRDPSSLRSLG